MKIGEYTRVWTVSDYAVTEDSYSYAVQMKRPLPLYTTEREALDAALEAVRERLTHWRGEEGGLLALLKRLDQQETK